MQSDRISELQRVSLLTQLVLKYHSSDIPFIDALIFAKELAEVVDELNFFKIDRKRFTLDFAKFFPAHWQQRTKFLKIVTELWPGILEELGKKDVEPKTNQSLYFQSSYSCLVSGLSKYANIKFIKNQVSIFEADDRFQEIDFIIDILKQNPQKTISVVAKDKGNCEFLVTRFQIENIDFTSYTENHNRNDPLDENWKEQVQKYFAKFQIPEDDWPKVEKELLQYLHQEKLPKRISVISPTDLKFCFSDIIIISSLNENSWRERYPGEFWLHRSIREKLKMTRKDSLEDNFYAAFNGKSEIFLTRAKKSSGTLNLKSSILEKFETKCELAGVPRKSINHKTTFRPLPKTTQNPGGFEFPKRLSAKGIELLMNDPYAFYAKEILNLKPKTPNDLKDLSRYFKDLMISCLSKDGGAGDILKQIKELDFFLYQKCQTAAEFLSKHKSKSEMTVYNAFGKWHFENDLNIDIVSYADQLVLSEKSTTLVCFKLFDNNSLSDIIKGSKSSFLTTSLVCEKGGFGADIPPIRNVQIWSLAPYGEEPFAIRNLEFSKELIEGYEKRLFEILKKYSENSELFFEENESKIDSYKHFERR